MKTLIMVTGNQHKIAEVQQILDLHGFSVMSYGDAGYDTSIALEETGATFEDNALIKVAPFFVEPGHILMADDSGLVVDALDGAPGIYSARYGGLDLTFTDRCKKILALLKGVSNRRARFVAVLVFKFEDQKTRIVRGVVEGTISHDMGGTDGFGYDPIFIPDGYTQTFSQMPGAQKNILSHRYRALQIALRDVL